MHRSECCRRACDVRAAGARACATAISRSNSLANDSTARRAALSSSPTLRSRSAIGRVAPPLDFVAGGDAAPRSAAAGASDCRSGRPADRDCAARPRCRRALRTACAPNGRCDARCAARRRIAPHGLAQQADHDLAIGERRVVVGDFAQPRRRLGDGRRVPARSARAAGTDCSKVRRPGQWTASVERTTADCSRITAARDRI